MVFFNYATMQMAAKVVYYGPGLCGKTTNLHHIYGRTAPAPAARWCRSRPRRTGRSSSTCCPSTSGVIGGFKTRVQLYTVPGQVFYNTTRKLVLKGVDGIVFVADSQRAMKDANVESLANLRTNLAEIGIKLEEIPLVFQYNKRDLANILSLEELEESLNPQRRHESYEACAVLGQGVFETLKAISRLTLRSLKKRMLGEEKPAAARRPRPQRAASAAPRRRPRRLAPPEPAADAARLRLRPRPRPAEIEEALDVEPGRRFSETAPLAAAPGARAQSAARRRSTRRTRDGPGVRAGARTRSTRRCPSAPAAAGATRPRPKPRSPTSPSRRRAEPEPEKAITEEVGTSRSARTSTSSRSSRSCGRRPPRRRPAPSEKPRAPARPASRSTICSPRA